MFGGNSQEEKAGEGVYVSATAGGNRRYYGVLIDQPALKEASKMWLQDQVDSLELNKRIKIMMMQNEQQKTDSNSRDINRQTNQEVTGALDANTALGETLATTSTSAQTSKRPATQPTTISNGGSDIKRQKIGPNGTLSSTATATKQIDSADVANNAETAIECIKSIEEDDRPVQKFKYVWNRDTKNVSDGQDDPGYRVLVATFCNVEEAAEGDLQKARSIHSACEEGGNFLPDDGRYYYQYEVLPAALQPSSLPSQLNELRTSMGMHSFFHNTELPPWFPLSNLQYGQHKLLSMLSMKRDNSGKVSWDNQPVDTTSSDAVAAVMMKGGTKLPMQPRNGNEYRIGVIGGGIAGLACCQDLITLLANQGIDAHVTLMEARPRLGGRLWTDKVVLENNNTSDGNESDKKSQGFPLEMGASWIHGIQDNPLASLAQQANIDFLTASEEVQMLGEKMTRVDNKIDERMGKLFDTLLDHAAEDSWAVSETAIQSTPQTAVRWYSSVFAQSGNDNKAEIKQQPQKRGVPPHRQSSDHSIDVEVAKAIGKYKLRDFSKLSEIEHRMLLWNTKNVEYALGANVSDLSMKFWDSDERHAFEGDHVLLKQGYSTVISHMFEALQKEGKDKFECNLNFPVGKVDYARKSVSQPYGKNQMQGRDMNLVEISDSCSVTTQDGSQTKYFDFLVCAAPLGVLKESVQLAGTEHSSDTLSFRPSLPFSKIDAITNVGFGLLDKVYIHFPQAFWRRQNLFKEDDQCLFGNVSGVNPHHYMFFDVGRCLASFEEDPPAILMSLVSGKEAVACERLSDDGLISEVLSSLRTIFPNGEVPTPSTYRITRWGRDKFARGSYTFLPPGATDQDFQLLQSPINGNGDSLWLDGSETMRLFWCGEHTTSLHPSMAHGAMLSGMRAAKELVASINLKNQEEKDVDKMIPVALFRHKSPTAPLQCSFCHEMGGQVRQGSLIAFKRGARVVLAHDSCAENSPEVEVVDLKWKNVIKAVNRGKSLNCVLCGKNGATIGCTAENCFRIFHFCCAEDTAWRFERDGKEFYCDQHRRHLHNRSTLCDRISMKFFLTKMPTSSMACWFCQSSDENLFYGSLVAFESGHKQKVCVHANCMKYTNVVDPGEVEGSRMGQEYSNVFLAMAQSKVCHECKKAGATIACTEPSCEKIFHLPCTRDSNWNFEKRGNSFRCNLHQGRHHGARLENSEDEKSKPVAAETSATGSFQHNLLNLFDETVNSSSNAMHENNPSNFDVGGTAVPVPTSPGTDDDDDTDESDSEATFPGADGNAIEVIDVRLTCELTRSKKLVRIERSSRTECWNISFKILEIEKARYLSVASAPASSSDDMFCIRFGDIIVSMDGKKIGSPELQCVRDVLSLLKDKVDMMLEVVRH